MGSELEDQLALMRLNSDTYHWLKSHLDYPFNASFDDNRLGPIPDTPIATTFVSQDGDYKPEVVFIILMT